MSLVRIRRGSNRWIPETPVPFLPPLAEVDSLPSPLEAWDEDEARRLIVEGTDDEVLGLVHHFQRPLLASRLDALVWARATWAVERTGIYLTPLIGLCISSALRPRKRAYLRSPEAIRLTPVFRSAGYCIQQVEEWLRAYGTGANSLTLLDYRIHRIVEILLRRGPDPGAEGVQIVYRRHGIGTLGHLIENPRLGSESIGAVLDILLGLMTREPLRPDATLPSDADGIPVDIGEAASFLIRGVLDHPQGRGSCAGLRARLGLAARRRSSEPDTLHPHWATFALVSEPGLGPRLMRAMAPTVMESWSLAANILQSPSVPEDLTLRWARALLARRSPSQWKVTEWVAWHLTLWAPRSDALFGPCQHPIAREDLRFVVRNLLLEGHGQLADRVLRGYPGLSEIPLTHTEVLKVLHSGNRDARAAITTNLRRIRRSSGERTPLEAAVIR